MENLSELLTRMEDVQSEARLLQIRAEAEDRLHTRAERSRLEQLHQEMAELRERLGFERARLSQTARYAPGQ
jgi:hypothetical protein